MSKAEQLVADGAVFPVARLPGYAVLRNGDATQMYLVRFEEGKESCTCPDFQHRQSKAGQPCKHILAATIGTTGEAAPEPASRNRGRAVLALLNDEDNELPAGW